MTRRVATRRATTGTLVALAVAAAGLWVTAGREHGAAGCAAPAVEDLASPIEAVIGWFDRARLADDTFWYEYDRSSDEFSPSYNEVRHAGVTMSLYQAAMAGFDDALTVADVGLAYIVDHLVVDRGRTAFARGDRDAELGATALAVAALVHRRIVTGDHDHDELLASMGRFLRSLQRTDGGMWARAARAGLDPEIGTTSTFYTGEAFWAFALLAQQFPDQGWDRNARSTATYLATERDAEEEIDDPPLADQWAAYGFSELGATEPLGGPDLRYVRELVDRYHGRLQREIGRERARAGDGGSQPDESVAQARGAAFGTTVEALGSLWRLSTIDPGLADLEPRLRADLECGAAILVARQYDPERAGSWPRPEVVDGAWFKDDVTRMDDQQHAMSGLVAATGTHRRAGE